MNTFTKTITFSPVECCECHTQFAMTVETKQQFQNDHEWFYCPFGHKQYYTGKSEKEELKYQLDQAERDYRRERQHRQGVENSLRTTKGHVTRIKNRVANGTCPCCRRHFANLERHMHSQHPEYTHD